jgi:hypothetical protein
MADGEDSGRFKQVVPSDEELVPDSVDERSGGDDSERADDDAEASDDKDVGENDAIEG